MRTVRSFAAGAVLWGSAAGSGSRSGASVFSGAALTGVSLVSCTGGAAAAASSRLGQGRPALFCLRPGVCRSNPAQIRRCTRVKHPVHYFSAAAPLCVSKPLRRERKQLYRRSCALLTFFQSGPALQRARRHLCGFDKFPLNNIAQSGEKIKWSPVIFSRSSTFSQIQGFTGGFQRGFDPHGPL